MTTKATEATDGDSDGYYTDDEGDNEDDDSDGYYDDVEGDDDEDDDDDDSNRPRPLGRNTNRPIPLGQFAPRVWELHIYRVPMHWDNTPQCIAKIIPIHWVFLSQCIGSARPNAMGQQQQALPMVRDSFGLFDLWTYSFLDLFLNRPKGLGQTAQNLWDKSCP